jgi:hypothetical protein
MRCFAAAAFLLLLAVAHVGFARTMPGNVKNFAQVKSIQKDIAVSDLSNAVWKTAAPISVRTYWSGVMAPPGRHFTARLLWSNSALYVRFEANRAEPLVVSDKPDLTKKSMGLWDRDVCEIFVAPDSNEPRRYFEFEAAPTGEWLDVALDTTSGSRKSDWGYASGMEVSARIEADKVVLAIKIPWKAFGKTPRAGDAWLGNLLRCVGKDPGRGYLAWQPTMTKEPAFHVPEKFGEFKFIR